MKHAFRWATKNRPSKFILKIDDDSFARVVDLAIWLEKFVDYEYAYVGNIFARTVKLKGKWADPKFKAVTELDWYPPYADGACGYVVSGPLAKFLMRRFHQLVCYANEDATLGWWINRISVNRVLPVQYVDVKYSVFTLPDASRCHYPSQMVIGHNMGPLSLERCYNFTVSALERVDHVKMTNPWERFGNVKIFGQ